MTRLCFIQNPEEFSTVASNGTLHVPVMGQDTVASKSFMIAEHDRHHQEQHSSSYVMLKNKLHQRKGTLYVSVHLSKGVDIIRVDWFYFHVFFAALSISILSSSQEQSITSHCHLVQTSVFEPGITAIRYSSYRLEHRIPIERRHKLCNLCVIPRHKEPQRHAKHIKPGRVWTQEEPEEKWAIYRKESNINSLQE